MSISDTSTIRKTSDFVETIVDGEVVLLHIVNGKFFSLKDTGRRAWELLDQNPQFGALVAAMQSEYDVDEDTCRTELQSLMAELQERTLVELA